MKPFSEASGVRSSWLALARKSTRVISVRWASVSSRIDSRARASAPVAVSGRTLTRQRWVWTPPVSISTEVSAPSNRAASTASSRSGSRIEAASRAGSERIRSTERAAGLA